MSTEHNALSCAACRSSTPVRQKWRPLPFYECASCGALFVHPQPSDEQLSDGYRSHYYPSDVQEKPIHENTPKAVVDQLLRCFIRRAMIRAPGGRLLDLGCGRGDFAAAALRAGIKVDAVEADDVARALAAQRGICVHANLEQLASAAPAEGYDLVTLLDVLEHVRDPLDVMKSVRRLLRPTGALYLSVPNHGSPKARLRGGRWNEATNPTHLFLFSARSMKYLLAAAGFSFGWLPCGIRDPAVVLPRQLLSVALQRLRLSATLRLVARPV